eukprot:scaffold160139_cov46-Attheya_sp.AAC.1
MEGINGVGGGYLDLYDGTAIAMWIDHGQDGNDAHGSTNGTTMYHGRSHQGRSPRILFLLHHHKVHVMHMVNLVGVRVKRNMCRPCPPYRPMPGHVVPRSFGRGVQDHPWWMSMKNENRFFTCHPLNPVNPNKCNRTSKC